MHMKLLEQIDFKIINLVTAEQAHTYQVIPYEEGEDCLCFYANEASPPPLAQLRFILGREVEIQLISAMDFERQLLTYYPQTNGQTPTRAVQAESESDIIRFVDRLFEEANALSASDIHIERYESYARVRFRWEGQLLEKYEVPPSQYNAVISRIKIISELDISERRLPQDGRINLDLNGSKIDIRVSTVPGKFGEKVVMRLLTRSKQFLQLENLGMTKGHLDQYLQVARQPNGIILITGPTGSGKTTTLYATLNLLNQPTHNICTVEDPIEYNLEGINQVQVKPEIGLTFESSLRAFLRQDPDIIMVGEIRDGTTAEIAIRAALTGHLVLSTLHTNSAIDAIVRLLDMGIPAYLLASSLRLVVAQRLIRILCPHCKTSSDRIIDASLQEMHELSTHMVPNGCAVCNYTGFSRRKAIYEMIPVGEDLEEQIKRNELNRQAYYAAHPDLSNLKSEVLKLIRTGETSLEVGMAYLYR